MNDRELATFILLAAAFVGVLLLKPARQELGRALKLLLTTPVGVLLGLFMVWIGGVVWAAHSLGLWSDRLVGGTILWFLLVGLAWFLGIGDASKEDDYFKKRVLQAIGIGAFLGAFVDLHVMPLPAELVAQVALTVVVILNVATGSKPELRPAARLTTGLLVIAGLSLLTYTVTQLISSRDELVLRDVLNELFLPIWLTLAAVPFICPLALYAGYESLLNQLTYQREGKLSGRAIAGMAIELRGSLVDIGSFRGSFARNAANATSIGEARQAVRDLKSERARDRSARAATRERLKDHAGAQGVDEEGLTLDRREYTESKEALRWVATCHIGWYRREDRADTYRSDLLDKVLTDFKNQGLPEDHGIVMKVRKDGQAWFAYRTTPSGHVFGIGASEAPPSQWFYDGPRPPSGFPSAKDSGWAFFMEPDRSEWREEDPI